MHINFVTESKQSSWILRPICEEYQKLIPQSTITDLIPDDTADINIFVNYKLYTDTPTKTVGYFTHKEDNSFDVVSGLVDYCIAMSNRTATLLPKDKTTVIEPSVDPMYLGNDIKIGWVGREYDNNRKRSTWLESLGKIEGVNIYATNGKIPKDKMPLFYKDMDYILITASNEGGPLPHLESLAVGTPVIAPKNVGWCDEYPAIRYETYEELENLLKSLVIKDTWKQGADKITEICSNLL
jgi:hypothetical protein